MTVISSSNASPYDSWAQHLKATADPLRLLILRALRQQSYGVLELSQLLDIQQSRLSHHLKILSRAGLVTQRREGNSIFYQRQPAPEPWVQTVFATLDQWSLPDDLATRQQSIEAERQEQARAFFARHATDFRERQDLIAEYPQYAEQALALLDEVDTGSGHALEVGPGLGEFLAALSQRFERVDAVDISAELLEQARARYQNDARIHFLHGDLQQWLTTYSQAPDLLVYNMVLHHIPTPGEELRRAGAALRSGGYLLVTDLCRHEQGWAREHCGDQWLGFDQAELDAWATEAGLSLERHSVTALRNGFQVQCLLWRKHAGRLPNEQAEG
ncbi:metalloregulator ArsR/SmtB family transcription factor [Natronospirillum operosum]|uniref:Metalloregulator ArsR/SmtB family transcription factor n=1 Tax=Natronospirillum operosum TaxID=2759953 RepID=A0A4Z0WBC8_9GAMM|nr:metalloregulator ArsR/SmtB family transcription factor [Natronospirillum operosum]TGG91770.1 metalloregulator ArsR/SmtB family transcription factor [Natronospirillum operosum]